MPGPDPFDHDVLRPGSHRATAITGDHALVSAMIRVEVAWVRALAAAGAATAARADEVADAAGAWVVDLPALARDAEPSGNPVVPLVAGLRGRLTDATTASLVHRGLTSQDVLDTALVLVADAAADRALSSLDEAAEAVAALAATHRDSLMVGRTLTQHAVPTTFGLVAAQWLTAVLDARHGLATVRGDLPVQCGGAAGTRSLLAEVVEDPQSAVDALATELGLVSPALPWHTRRRPVTAVADAIVTLLDTLGSIATQVSLLSRPEIGELSEGGAAGRGGSSTMPQKQNPVLSVLVRAAALQGPLLAAQVHLAAAQQVDQRPDGAWHSEWPAFRELLTLAVIAADQASELMAGLEVHAHVMRERANAERRSLLAELHGAADRVPDVADPAAYLGQAGVFVDRALARFRERSVHE